jgi:hypothetical protein
MKKLLMMAFVLVTAMANAQTETSDEKKPFFDKQKLFTGGDFGIYFGNRTFSIGLTPFLGYSFNEYVDVAAAFNFNYQSIKDTGYSGDVIRNTTFGAGAFVRLFPVNFLYVQAQFERNFISAKLIPGSNSYYYPAKLSLAVNSYLIGAGYTSGREGTSNSYYYFSLLFDVGNDINSPYIDQFGNKDPIIRAGFNFPLFGSGDRSGSRREARRSRRGDD